MALTDGTEHACTLRSAVTESLARISQHGMRRYITRYATRLVDAFATEGEADLVADFARKLTALVICQQFGIRENDALLLGDAVTDMVSGRGTAPQSNSLVVDVMSKRVEEGKQQPGEDLASWLIGHESGLTDEEVCEHLRLALVGALEPHRQPDREHASNGPDRPPLPRKSRGWPDHPA